MLSDNEYSDLLDETIQDLEDALDEVEEDLDYELGGGVLTVKFTNGVTLVFSRQPPVKQLWFASPSGGYHYEYDSDAGDWRDTRSGDLFRPFVISEFQSQGGISLPL